DQAQLCEQYWRRWSGLRSAAAPRCQPLRYEKSLEATLFKVLACLGTHPSSAASQLLEAVNATELRKSDPAPVQKVLDGGDVDPVGWREINRASLEIPVEEEVVAATKVDNL